MIQDILLNLSILSILSILIIFGIIISPFIIMFKWNEKRRKDQDERMQRNIEEALRKFSEKDISNKDNHNNDK